MSDPQTLRIELELARGVEPISGQVRGDEEPARAFAGVLELIALLDSARAASGPDDRVTPGGQQPWSEPSAPSTCSASLPAGAPGL